MLWLIFALGAAFCFGVSSVIAKKVLQTEDHYLVALGKFLYAVPFLLPLLFFIEIPELSVDFWVTISIILPFEIAGLLLFMKGIKESPVALTIPFLSFTPVFSIFTSLLILGEQISFYGVLGIILVVMGTYILNIKKVSFGFWAPFKAIGAEKGSWIFMIVAIIFSFTNVLGKRGVMHSSPLFFSVFYVPYITLFLLPIISRKTKVKKLFIKPGLMVVIGFLLALSIIFQFIGISMIEAAYFIAIKETSMIVAIVGAYYFF